MQCERLILQVRERLLDPYYHQWLRDTEELLEKLPHGLEAPEQGPPLLLTFERWLLQLKVMLTAALTLRCTVRKSARWTVMQQ